MQVDFKGEKIVVDYTTDEEISDLMESDTKDFCVEFTGYLAESYGIIMAGKDKDKELFKCVITNGSHRITLLIWDKVKIRQLFTEMIPSKILHIDGCEGLKVPRRDEHDQMNLLNYELIIQGKTVVNILGFHLKDSLRESNSVSSIKFDEIGKAVGVIKVKAYIKTVVAASCTKSGKSSYGSGSLTEGIHKIPITISCFKEGDSSGYSKGTCVLVTGTVSSKGPVSLTCPDMSCIEILAGEPKLPETQVMKANKPLKRSNEEMDSSNNKKMKT